MWLSFSKALFFLDRGSGEDETDEATAHESFELSELNEMSMTPFGLPGIEEPNLRLFLDHEDDNSMMSLEQSSTRPCFESNQELNL